MSPASSMGAPSVQPACRVSRRFHFVPAPDRAPSPQSCGRGGDDETLELVGLATETKAEHARRHSPAVASCPRCLFMRRRQQWLEKYGSTCTTAGGIRRGRGERIVWIAERPPHWGGPWAIGCLVCAQALLRLPAGSKSGHRLCNRWARFEVMSYKCMHSFSPAQHAATDAHRVAIRAFLSPDAPAVEVLRTSEEDALFRGAVPQPSHWLRVWRFLKCPSSWHAAEQTNETENFLNSVHGRPLTRKACHAMAEVLAEACRVEKRKILLASWSIAILIDDKGPYRMIRYKCDGGPPAGGPADPGECPPPVSACTGLLALLRDGGRGENDRLQDFSEDHAVRMATSIVEGIRRLATPLDSGETNEPLVAHVLSHCRVFCSDGAVLKCGRILRERHMPNIVLLLRDAAHALRPALGAKTLMLDTEFAAQWDQFFGEEKAFVSTLQHSDALQAKLRACQRQVLQHGPGLGGRLAHVMRHFSFAKHRWESTHGPRRKLCCLLLPVAVLLAYMADDARLDKAARQRYAKTLEAINGAEVVRLGLQADFTAETTEFLREFDVADPDPAITPRRKAAFIARMQALFGEGRVLAEIGGFENASLTSIAVSQIKEPVTLRYQDRMHTLSMQGATRACRDALARLQLVTDVMVARIEAELPGTSLVACFSAFDLERWETERRQGSAEGVRKLLDTAARLFRVLHLDEDEGKAQFKEAIRKALDLRRLWGRPQGKLDNRAVWSQIHRHTQDGGGSERVLRLYLSVAISTGTVERHLGHLARVLGMHKGGFDMGGGESVECVGGFA